MLPVHQRHSGCDGQKLTATICGAFLAFPILLLFAPRANSQAGSEELGESTSLLDTSVCSQQRSLNDVVGQMKYEPLSCGLIKAKQFKTTKQLPAKANFSGVANYYADYFHGKRTASGEIHDRTKFTAAHRSLPFGTKLKVVNRQNGKSCVVTVNDRGPFTENRIIDLSMAAAKELGFLSAGSRMVDCYIVDREEF